MPDSPAAGSGAMRTVAGAVGSTAVRLVTATATATATAATTTTATATRPITAAVAPTATRPVTGAATLATMRLLTGALVLTAFILRLLRLGDQNVWWDEGLAVWAVRKPWLETTYWTAGDVHPPLFFWTLWPWMRLVGQTEFALRLITVVWAMLTAVLAYALARRLGGQLAGLLALALVAISPFEVWWSMELRMYMLAGTMILLALYAQIRWLAGAWSALDPDAAHGGSADSDAMPGVAPGCGREIRSQAVGGSQRGHLISRHRWLLAHHLAALAALYTLYLAAVAVVAFNLTVLAALLARRLDRGRTWAWIAAQSAAVLLFVPWLALALPRMASWSSIRTPASAGFVAELWATLMATGVSTHLATVRGPTLAFWLAAIGALLIAARGVAARWWQHHLARAVVPAAGRGDAASSGVAVLLLALFAVLPPLAVWAATQPRSLFYSPQVEARYLLPFAGPVYVLAAWGVATTLRRWRPLGLLVAAGVLFPLAVYLPRYYSGRHMTGDLATMALAIWSQAEPGDVVLLVSGNRYPLFHYYYDQPWVQPAARPVYEYPVDRPPQWADRPAVIDFPDRGSEPVEAGNWQARLEEVVASHPRVWLVEFGRDLQDPNGRVLQWLNERSPRVLSEGYGPDALHLYASDGQPPRLTGLSGRMPGVRPVDAAAAADHLPAIGLPAPEALPGDTLSITLFGLHGQDGDSTPAAVSLWPQSGSPAPVWSASLVPSTDGAVPWRVRLAAPISERMPSGRHRLALAAAAGEPVTLSAVTVRATAPLMVEWSERDARFGPAAFDLIGAGLSRHSLQPGGALVVDLWWRRPSASATGDRRLLAPPVVFAHLAGPPRSGSGDPVWAVQDGPPSSGPWPTQAVDTVFDRHILVLDEAAPPGSYLVEVGLYDPETGERWPVSGMDADPVARRVILAEVTVH